MLSTSDGLETPSFGNVHLSFSGEGMLASEVRTYQYDEAGNIEMVTTVTDAGSSTDARTHNDLNQIEEQVVGGDTWTFSYDDNGNMTGKTDGTDTWTYSWNDENRLVRVQGPGSVDIAYSYDSMGRMLTRDDGGPDITQLTWDHWDCIKEVTGESETVYHIPQGQILSFIRDGERYELHTDPLGSCRMITDSEGEVAAEYEYSGFGEAISISEVSAVEGFPVRFVGALGVRFDPACGLHFMRNRWFDCQNGRFLSRDPLGTLGMNSSYAYAGCSPLNFTDSTGLWEGIDTVNRDGETQHFDNFDEFVSYATERPVGDIVRMAISSHANPENMEAKNFFLRVVNDKVQAFYKDKQGNWKYKYWDELGLDKLKIRSIELRGCNTAGTPPRDIANKMYEEHRKRGDLTRDHWNYVYGQKPMKTNLSYQMARANPGTIVKGSLGAWVHSEQNDSKDWRKLNFLHGKEYRLDSKTGAMSQRTFGEGNRWP